MRILILGINHQIQPADIRSWGSGGGPQKFERGQKEHFALLLQETIAENGVQIVAEESRHGQETITMRVCESANCRYANIEMSPDERSVRGIPPGYNENLDTTPSDRERWNREREEYIAEKAMSEASGAESAMVICGRNHVQVLVERFSHFGHTVETNDLQNQSWYIEDWMERMMWL
jgi:hypothetical protein